MSTHPGVVLVVEVCCAQCGGKPKPDKHCVFVELEPWLGNGKKDYVPTQEERSRPPIVLCLRCWLDGVRPNAKPSRLVEPAA